MNIVEASNRVGQALRKLKEGEELYKLYENLKSQLSHESWDCFNKMRPMMLHYFGFPISLQIIEGNLNRDELHQSLKNQIDEISKSELTKNFCGLCKSFGSSIEQVVKDIFVPTKTPKSFADFNTPPQLRRALQDLHVVVLRTGIFKEITKYVNPNTTNIPSLVGSFESNIEERSHHFSKSRRRLLTELASNQNELKMLVAFHSFKTAMDVIKQLIFESHFGLILYLDNDNIQKVKVRERSKARYYIMNLNNTMFDIMEWYGTIIMYRHGIHDEFGLVTERSIRWNRSEDMKIKISGYFYPQNDRDILS